MEMEIRFSESDYESTNFLRQQEVPPFTTQLKEDELNPKE